MKRTPLKRGTKGLKRGKGLRKVSKARLDKLSEKTYESKKMWAFFRSIWEKTPQHKRVCYETGEQLGEPMTYMFHHLLHKETYPQYKFKEWNIVLVSWKTHDQVHMDIDRTPKIKALRDNILKNLQSTV